MDLAGGAATAGQPGQAPAPAPGLSKRRSDGSAAEVGQTTKRSKIALACEDCRERKRRCDGAKPRCGACVKRGPTQNCVYEEDRWKKGWPTSIIASLKERIAELERAQNPVAATPAITNDPTASAGPSNASFPELDALSNRPQRSVQSLPPLDKAISTNTRYLQSTPSSLTHGAGADHELDHHPHTWNGPGDVIPPSRTPQRHLDVAFGNVNGATLTPAATINEFGSTEDSESCVDAMGTTSGNQVVSSMALRTPSVAYFGPSSVVTFMSRIEEIIRKVNRPNESPDDRPLASGGSDAVTRGLQQTSFQSSTRSNTTFSSSTPEANDYLIPTRKEADALVRTYFMNVHHLFPILHEQTFYERYLKLWSAGEDNSNFAHGPFKEQKWYWDDITFYITLNLVFAFGCRSDLSINATERIAKSERFFLRAQKAIIFEVLSYASIELLQSHLLMGQYLQSTERSAKCWNVVGLATRIAQGMGLHLDVSPNRTKRAARGITQLQVEMRRRLWWGCILLDRELSMAYGRPFMVHPSLNRGIRIPNIIDDGLLATQAGSYPLQPEGTPSTTAFFVHSVKLSDILGEILIALYYPNEGPLKDESSGVQTPTEGVTSLNPQSLLLIDASLTRWRKNLPPYLAFGNEDHDRQGFGATLDENSDLGDAGKTVFRRQAKILQAKYLHLRILLLRPMVLVLFDKKPGHPRESLDSGLLNVIFNQTMLTTIANICVSSAQELVDLITDSLKISSSAMPAWWYNIYFVYTCAIVILAGRLSASIEGRTGKMGLAQSWEQCLGCLKHYSTFSQPAEKSFKALEMIDEKFFRSNREPMAFEESSAQSADLDQSARHDTSTTEDQVNQTAAVDGHSVEIDYMSTARGNQATSNSGTTRHDNPISNHYDFDAESINHVGFGLTDLNWTRDDLHLDWFNSMPFADDNYTGSLGFEGSFSG